MGMGESAAPLGSEVTRARLPEPQPGDEPGGSSGTDRAAAVLLVEDTADDVMLTRRAFRRCGLAEPDVASDGVAALAYLRGRAAGADLPALVLLDLKLPRLSGLELLRELRADPALRTVPVVVLTSSRHEGDIAAAYAAGANSYVVKPVEFAAFVEVVRAIDAFWLGVAVQPPLPSASTRPAAP